METKEYINKKNRIYSDLKTYCRVNQLRIICEANSDRFKIFDKDFYIAEILILKQDQLKSFLIRFIIPMMSDFTIANVTILRPVLGDKDIRDFMGNDRILYAGHSLKILRELNIDSRKSLNKNLVYATITALFSKSIKGMDLIANKMDSILQVKLN